MSSRLGIFKHIATAVAFQKSLKTVKVVNKFNKTPKRANAVIWRQNKWNTELFIQTTTYPIGAYVVSELCITLLGSIYVCMYNL